MSIEADVEDVLRARNSAIFCGLQVRRVPFQINLLSLRHHDLAANVPDMPIKGDRDPRRLDR
ncbi:hypothetical protein [Sphingopyxis sp.]|uniref:hypothetical protein n=1 Tax=Sphingopyxis sp. TaxID=1908224 RepID=UPI0025E58BFE|nr:hypothetical protein [Sphingopyxis sp.]